MDLPAELLALLKQPSTCYIATTMPDGSPQLTQVWGDTDGTHVLVNTVQGHQKVRNIERDPRVAVTVSDPAHPSRYHAVRGRVVDVTSEGGVGAHRGPGPALPGSRPTRGTADATRSASCSPSPRTGCTRWADRVRP